MTIEEHYQKYKSIPRDIDRDLENLYNVALECEHITEFGTNIGTSSSAFLRTKPKTFITVDYVYYNEATPLFEDAKAELTDSRIERITADTREIEIEETSFLFIDTMHDYDVLSKELELHGNKATKFIGFHDTISFGNHNECKPGPGLLLAINEFLEKNPHWKLKHHFTGQNGVMILERE